MQVAAAHLPSKVQHCRIKVMLESSLHFRILNPLDPAYSPKETIEYLLKIIQEEVPVAAVAWFVLVDRWEQILTMTGLSLGQIGTLTIELLLWTSMKIAAMPKPV